MESLFALVVIVEVFASLIVMLLTGLMLHRQKDMAHAVGMLLRVFTYGALLVQWQTGEPLTVASEHYSIIAGTALGLFVLNAVLPAIISGIHAEGDITPLDGPMDNVIKMVKDRVNVWARIKAGRGKLLTSGAFILLSTSPFVAWMWWASQRKVNAAEYSLSSGVPGEGMVYVIQAFASLMVLWLVFAAVADFCTQFVRIALPVPEVEKPDGAITSWLRKRLKKPSAVEA